MNYYKFTVYEVVQQEDTSFSLFIDKEFADNGDHVKDMVLRVIGDNDVYCEVGESGNRYYVATGKAFKTEYISLIRRLNNE